MPAGLRGQLLRVTLGRKLAGGFALLVIVVGLVVGVSVVVSDRLASATNHITNRTLPDLTAGYAVGQDAAQLATQQARYVIDGGTSLAAYAAADNNLGEALVRLNAAALHNTEQVALSARVQGADEAFATNNDTIFSLVQQHHMQAAINLAGNRRSSALVNNLEQAAQAFIANARREAAAAVASSHSTQAAGRTIELVLAGAAVLAAILVGFFITRGIRRGVKPVLNQLRSLNDHCATYISDALEHLANGDLTYEVTPATERIEKVGRDELGQIAAAVNGIRERMVAALEAYSRTRQALKGMIGSVADTATTVGTSSEQMAKSSEEGGRSNGEIARAVDEIAEGAERQAQMIEDARTAVDDVVVAATGSAEHARATVEAAIETRNVARAGVGAAQQASDAMTSVRDSAIEVNQTIGELAAKSGQIGKIVETITGIAKQTNLLALNAAIEAARAGEQGRSFAVVAEQVRALAEESQLAAHEIAELIGAIQRETATAVGVVEEGTRRTEDGTAIVEQTREAFVQIGESIEDMTARIEAIAAGSEQIAHSARAMHESITDVASVAEESSAATEQVSAATQQTYASAQEIAARAHSLSSTADELNELVRRFRLAA